MKKIISQFLLLLALTASTSHIYALSDDFYASGEDLDYLFDTDSNYVIETLENHLRQFVLYRKIEDLLYDLGNQYPGINH